MAECGICLDILRNPVAVPCGHVHCERCLRCHISSGADALKSACPTCRKPFYIAAPDFAFVPQKYHDFILPSVRKVYMDIPSVAAMTRELDGLTKRLEEFAKENAHLRQRCTQYKDRIAEVESENLAIVDQREEAQQETIELRRKYDSLKKRYREALSRENVRNSTASQNFSRMSNQLFDSSREIIPKIEEDPESLHLLGLNQPRPKRALPKSRLSNGVHCKDEPCSPVIVKRQRTHRHSDVGPSSQRLADEDDLDEDDPEEEDE